MYASNLYPDARNLLTLPQSARKLAEAGTALQNAINFKEVMSVSCIRQSLSPIMTYFILAHLAYR
jgi:hypothetical protein